MRVAGPAVLAFACACAVVCARDATAQEATSVSTRWLTVGGEGLASVASDDPGYFDDTSYRQSAMRLLRARIDVSLRLGPRAAVLAEGRVDNGDGATVSALYLRLRPLRDRAFDLQVGRIPPVFGTFARRGYGLDNPLIGSPLIYQYLTALRADALPGSADDLLAMRGRGWLTHYPVGSTEWDRGLPVIAGDRWDTGAEVRIGAEPVSLAVALTQGVLSDPLVRDDNGGKQLSARVQVRPTIGLVLGLSGGSGRYLSRQATSGVALVGVSGPSRQDAVGLDAEYSRGYWMLRAEGVASRWDVPVLRAPLVGSVRAWGGYLEARYKVRPGLYGALRADRLAFSTLSSGLYDTATSWDAPVTRLEVAAGYSVRRNLTFKAAVQENWRSGVAVRQSETVVGAQALFWF